MKGVIAICLGELVKEKFGTENWERILEMSGLDPKTEFLAFQDIDDDAIMNVLDSTCKVLKISMSQAADAFGAYWVNVYAPKMYKIYYRNIKDAKEFIIKMDEVHDKVTKSMKNAKPPRFQFEEPDEKTLIVNYRSHRGLIDIYIGLVKGVGIYFNENLRITKIGATKVKITFS